MLAGLSASSVRFDNSIEIWFLEGDPSIATYQAYLDRFEADEVAVLALFADDVFSPDAMAALDRMTRAAEDAPHVHRVLSITNAEVYESRDDAVQIAPLVEPLPTTTRASARIRAPDSTLVRAARRRLERAAASPPPRRTSPPPAPPDASTSAVGWLCTKE